VFVNSKPKLVGDIMREEKRREEKRREEKVDKVQVELYCTNRLYFCEPQTIRPYFCKPQRRAVNPKKVVNYERNIHVP
jgi:hypothetical protein